MRRLAIVLFVAALLFSVSSCMGGGKALDIRKKPAASPIESKPTDATKKTPNGPKGLQWVHSKPANLYFTKSEITLGQYTQCVAAGKCEPKHHTTKSEYKYCNWGYENRDTHPMNCVDWYGAQQFCQWAEGRLPTENEWYAEASNNKTRKFPWGDEDISCSCAVWGDKKANGCGKDSTWPVCSKPRGNSVSGLCDMSGNVWEWTSTSLENARVLRGGSWGDYDAEPLHASAHSRDDPTGKDYNVGFRCVRGK